MPRAVCDLVVRKKVVPALQQEIHNLTPAFVEVTLGEHAAGPGEAIRTRQHTEAHDCEHSF